LPADGNQTLWLKSGFGTSCRQLIKKFTLFDGVCEEIISREIDIMDFGRYAAVLTAWSSRDGIGCGEWMRLAAAPRKARCWQPVMIHRSETKKA